MMGGGKTPTRLVDGAPEDAGASEAWAVDLLRGAEPYRAPAGRKQRVQLRLGRAGKRPRRLFARTALVGLVMFGCGAIASSAFGRWPEWVVDAYHRVVGVARTAPAPVVETRAPVRRSEIPARPPATVVTASEAVTVVAPPAPRRAVSAPTVRARRVAPAAATEDTAAIMEAMRALRVERNPARARQLLARYLEQYPNGALAEEALALALEAAVARGDGDAAALAARYLKLYPTGPFNGLARQTLAAAR